MDCSISKMTSSTQIRSLDSVAEGCWGAQGAQVAVAGHPKQARKQARGVDALRITFWVATCCCAWKCCNAICESLVERPSDRSSALIPCSAWFWATKWGVIRAAIDLCYTNPFSLKQRAKRDLAPQHFLNLHPKLGLRHQLTWRDLCVMQRSGA
jgi:hypothetical protein